MNSEPPPNSIRWIETNRLKLCALSEADAGSPHAISNEPPVRRYLWDDEPVSLAMILDIIAQSIRMFSEVSIGLFGVRVREKEDLLGFRSFVRLGGMA